MSQPYRVEKTTGLPSGYDQWWDVVGPDGAIIVTRPWADTAELLAHQLNAAYTAGLAAQREDSVLQPEAEASRHGNPATTEQAALRKDTVGDTATEGK